MADDSEDTARASPPLPKSGSYNLDFDNLDDSINPFESKVKLGSSPPIRTSNTASLYDDIDDIADPFKPKTKLSNSPPGSPKVRSKNNEDPLPCDDIHDVEDPFKGKSKMANSPPTSPKMKSNNNNNNFVECDGTQINAKPVSSDISDPGMVKDDGASQPGSKDDLQSGDTKQNAPVTPKKKKVVKKPKAQSKLKLPRNVKPAQNTDDIQIFVPGQDDSSSKPASEIPEDQPPQSPQSPKPQKVEQPVTKEVKSKSSSKKGQKNTFNDSENDMPFDAAPDAMASSSEIDQQFVDREDMEEPEHVNEGFAATTDGLDNLDDDWEMLGKHSGGEGKVSKADDDSLLSQFDPMVPPSTEKLAKASSSPEGGKIRQKSDEDLLEVNTPPQGKTTDTSNTKHPAARVLETQVDGSLTVADNKNESSSEDSQFYDAYDYPPGAATKAKLGQKSSTAMERGPNHEEGGDNKGTVVQLVQDGGGKQVLRYSQSDWNKMKQEMELNFQASLLNKERDWSLMLGERDKKIVSLEESNRKLKHTNEDMRMVVAEFEKTISQLQAEKEKSKTDSSKTVQTLESERDQAIEDLQSVESAFSDLHRRYEKSKSIIEGFKRNEDQLKTCVEDLQAKLKKSEGKLQSLRSQAEEKLDKANEDIEKIKKSTKQDLVRLEAALKKAELRNSSLEESLQRKEKENLELTAICDELIAKVGS